MLGGGPVPASAATRATSLADPALDGYIAPFGCVNPVADSTMSGIIIGFDQSVCCRGTSGLSLQESWPQPSLPPRCPYSCFSHKLSLWNRQSHYTQSTEASHWPEGHRHFVPKSSTSADSKEPHIKTQVMESKQSFCLDIFFLVTPPRPFFTPSQTSVRLPSRHRSRIIGSCPFLFLEWYARCNNNVPFCHRQLQSKSPSGLGIHKPVQPKHLAPPAPFLSPLSSPFHVFFP